jgi:outer membrane protein assembly factor BamB
VLACAGALACVLVAAPASAQFGQQALPPPPPDAKAATPGEAHGTELRSTMRVALESAPVAQAAVLGGAAYVPLKDGRFVAVDLEAGRVKWSLDLPTSLPAVAGDALVFVAGDEMLTAVAPDATVKWRLPLPGGFSAPPAFAGGWLIVGATGGDVLCLRAADGKVMWTQHVGAALQPGAGISGEVVYLGLADGAISAHRLADGTPIWTHKLGASPRRSSRSTTGCSWARRTSTSTASTRRTGSGAGAGAPAARSSAAPRWTSGTCTSPRSTTCCARSTAMADRRDGRRASRSGRPAGLS